METMERTQEREHEPRHRQRRAWPMVTVVLLAVLALFGAGMVGRWTAPDEAPVAVVVGNGDLTERQEQMVDMMDEAIAAWRASDGAAVTAMWTPDGVFDASAVGRGTYLVDDGSLAALVEDNDWSSLVGDEPMLIWGNRSVCVYNILGAEYMHLLTFTYSGELRIVEQEVIAG